MGPNLREAIPRQYGPFLPINGATSLTRRSERISKWEILGSRDGFRTPNLSVNSQVFETFPREWSRETRMSLLAASCKEADRARAATERVTGGFVFGDATLSGSEEEGRGVAAPVNETSFFSAFASATSTSGAAFGPYSAPRIAAEIGRAHV